MKVAESCRNVWITCEILASANELGLYLFYGVKRSRLQNSQLIPLLQNSSWGDGAMVSLLSF